MSNKYLNWEVHFKRAYPYSGPIWIDTDNNNIKCYVYSIRQRSVYLPFVYSISSKVFTVSLNSYSR